MILTKMAALVNVNDAEGIAERVMESEALRSELRSAAEPTIAVLRDVGAFRLSEVAEVFAQSAFEFERSYLEG